jgi:aspartyl-tRNA(Asn)/glutamyl-tRNA(Gln) amidotransferase subunit C
MDWTRAIDGYCERTDPGYWSEPINAITNFAFLIAAVVMWRRVRGQGMPLAMALVVILAAIGVGSYLYPHRLADVPVAGRVGLRRGAHRHAFHVAYPERRDAGLDDRGLPPAHACSRTGGAVNAARQEKTEDPHVHRHRDRRAVAKLARIKVEDDDALPALAQEFNAILGFIEQLNEVDVEGVEPMTSVTPMRLKRREDVVTDGNQQDKVLANAPDAREGFFAVPKVVEYACPS